MTEKFEAWGFVELMGHQRNAGRLSEQQIAGANLLRVDTPQGDTFRTTFYGPSAIYAVHVTDETAARAMAAAMGTRPAYAWEVESQLEKAQRAVALTHTPVEDPEAVPVSTMCSHKEWDADRGCWKQCGLPKSHGDHHGDWHFDYEDDLLF